MRVSVPARNLPSCNQRPYGRAPVLCPPVGILAAHCAFHRKAKRVILVRDGAGGTLLGGP